MSDHQTLRVDRIGRVQRITLNRPEAGNGMNLTMVRELVEVAATCDLDPEVRAVLITGGEGKFFCVGGDLKEMEAHADSPGPFIKSLADTLHRALSTLARMDAPTVIAVNGVAAGAGFSLGIGGDYVIAAESATYTMAYTRSGLSPDGSSTFLLPRLVGLRRAQDLMLTNRRLSAAEALDWGLISRVVPDDQLAEAALETATRIAAGSRGAQAAVKRLLLDSFATGFEAQMELESRHITACAASPDGAEGREAFIGKRSPTFA